MIRWRLYRLISSLVSDGSSRASLAGDDDPVVDQFGDLVAAGVPDYDATRNTSSTRSRGWGAGVQATVTGTPAARENTFIAGASVDGGSSRYGAETELGRLTEAPADKFTLDDSLWASVVYEFAAAYHQRKLDRQHLLKSLTPLYLGWVSSYVVRTQTDTDDQAEQKIEQLALAYEQLKARLVERWDAK